MTATNRVILSGRVVTPPQRSFRPDGSPVIQFSLEVTDPEDSSARSARSVIDIVAFDRLAEFELDRLQSGQPLMVEGRLKQRRWKTPEGKNKSHIEVIATDLQVVTEDEPKEERRR
jgi:single-strand DNA-binding protein